MRSFSDCIVGPARASPDVRLADSMVGAEARVEGVRGRVNVGEYAELRQSR
jgi:hypothetical protein